MEKTNSINYSHVIELSKKEHEEMEKIAFELRKINPIKHSDLFCKKAKKLSEKIPIRIKKILNDFLQNETGFLIIRTIPFIPESIPKTPLVNINSIGSNTLIASIQSIFISYLGEMISYEAEGDGKIFQDIVPVSNMGINQTSYNSDVELEIHTEQAFSKIRPDILGLGCLRGDEKAFTYVLPLNKILENITKEEYELLLKPLWKIGIDMSFKKNGYLFLEGDIRGPFPIINNSSVNGEKTLVFDQDLMKGITEESNYLLEKIVDIYYKNRIGHNLQSGEIILIDNRHSLHGRSSFTPKYDGNDRFLIRCFAVTDYESTKYARPNEGRMVSAIFS
jgi:L-asparagine oxygenase